MRLIFKDDGKSKAKAIGYSTVPYTSDDTDEKVVKTTENELTSVFESAQSDDESIDLQDSSLNDAVDDPISFYDYLILVDGSINFNGEHERRS